MTQFRYGLERVLLALWIGGALALSALALPAAFRVLPREIAGLYVQEIFSVYFQIQLGLWFFLCILEAIRLKKEPPRRSRIERWYIGLLVTTGICLALNTFWIQPKMQAVRDSDRPTFLKLHGVSMAANAVVLVAGIPLVALPRRPEDSVST